MTRRYRALSSKLKPGTRTVSPRNHNDPPDKLSTFYRVSVKAIVLDDHDRLLLFCDNLGGWELPGGGWEHGETYQECLTRELREEVQAKTTEIGEPSFVYTHPHESGYYKLFVAVPVKLAQGQLVPSDDDLVEARYVTKAQMQNLPFQLSERGILKELDQIWLPLKKPA